ncbi:Depudecin biosynthesis cluster-specific transcription activator like protein [Verticillium longisporum]|nr:Depudecin biosynthesis cluster-specific transcription activator like protein [Verticillium longisporum]
MRPQVAFMQDLLVAFARMDGAEGISAPTKTAKTSSVQPDTHLEYICRTLRPATHPCAGSHRQLHRFLSPHGATNVAVPKLPLLVRKGQHFVSQLRVVASGLVRSSSALPRLDDYFDSTVPERDRHTSGHLLLCSARPHWMEIEGRINGFSDMNKTPSDEGSNPLKRRNTDAGVDYPRRRATIACEVCRSRKSRCDGTKPKCKLCTELGAECIYREPGIKLDAGDKLILERLNRIESLLQMNMVAGGPSGGGIQISHESPSMSNGSGLNGENLVGVAGTTNFTSIIPSGGLGTWHNPPNISTMPKIHTNAALHLLQWPLIRDLVSRPYDPQILLQLEMAREPLHSLTKTPCVDLSNTTAYIEAYFDHVNVCATCWLLRTCST